MRIWASRLASRSASNSAAKVSSRNRPDETTEAAGGGSPAGVWGMGSGGVSGSGGSVSGMAVKGALARTRPAGHPLPFSAIFRHSLRFSQQGGRERPAPPNSLSLSLAPLGGER
jgi:hypothetical protein